MKVKQITVKFPEGEAEKLSKFAKENNLSVAEQVRKLVIRGISISAYQTDEEKILADMQLALKNVLDPQIERIVKISVKNSITSSINALHTVALMYRLTTNDNARRKLEIIFEQARRLGIDFVKQGQGAVDKFLESAVAQINATWERE